MIQAIAKKSFQFTSSSQQTAFKTNQPEQKNWWLLRPLGPFRSNDGSQEQAVNEQAKCSPKNVIQYFRHR